MLVQEVSEAEKESIFRDMATDSLWGQTSLNWLRGFADRPKTMGRSCVPGHDAKVDERVILQKLEDRWPKGRNLRESGWPGD